MNFFKHIFLLVACSIVFVANAEEVDFFQKPQTCSEQQLSELMKEKTLNMCWNFGEGSHFRFISSNEEIYFDVALGLLPEIYDDFLNRVRHKFIQSESGQFIFSYKINSAGYEEINIPSMPHKDGHPDEYSYIVTDRRVISDGHPSLISQSTLESIVKNYNILFYTGAGISLASSVPAMNELNELLGLDVGEGFLFSLEHAIESPSEFASKIRIFHDACFYNAPTPAHYALKDISLYRGTRLITENLDCLHEASGILPYRVNAQQLREEVGGKSTAQYDYIICVGLSFDDRGLLGWYKEQNPKGKIVAIDLFQPSYLGDEDYWLMGDLQTLIPEMRNAILLHEENLNQ